MTLDRDPFQRELRAAQAEGEKFEARKFEAKAGLDASEFRRELASVAVQASRMGAGRASVGLTGQQGVRQGVNSLITLLNRYGRIRARANVGLVGVQTTSQQLQRITRSVQRFGRERAVARVAVDGADEADRGLRRSAVAAGLARIGFRGAGEGAGLMGRTFRGASSEIGDTTLHFTKLGPAAGIPAAKLALVVGVGKPLAVGLAAIVSSAARAATGLGALGVAAGGALVAGMILAGATIARYKRQAQEAGTMSNRVARELRGLRGAFARVMGQSPISPYSSIGRYIRRTSDRGSSPRRRREWSRSRTRPPRWRARRSPRRPPRACPSAPRGSPPRPPGACRDPRSGPG